MVDNNKENRSSTGVIMTILGIYCITAVSMLLMHKNKQKAEDGNYDRKNG